MCFVMHQGPTLGASIKKLVLMDIDKGQPHLQGWDVTYGMVSSCTETHGIGLVWWYTNKVGRTQS